MQYASDFEELISPPTVIAVFDRGDMTEPNPDASATLRAGQLAGPTTYFRNDLAFAGDPNFGKDPDAFLIQVCGNGSRCARSGH